MYYVYEKKNLYLYFFTLKKLFNFLKYLTILAYSITYLK